MSAYPLYDVPYLVRDPNDSYMSLVRHKIEVQNQEIVDQYFIERDKGASATEAREAVATKHGITPERVYTIVKWFFNQARIRKKYDFLIKFAAWEEH